MSNRQFEPLSSLKAAKSKANYLFEGDFRRRPNQNLSGASRSLDRVQLLQQAAEQRQNREDVRQRELGSTKIQSAWRGYRYRKSLRSQMGKKFDDTFLNQAKPFAITMDNEYHLERILKEFILFYHSASDQHRFRAISKLMVEHRDFFKKLKDINAAAWIYKIIKLLRIELRLLDINCETIEIENLSFFETYTSKDLLNPGQQRIVWNSLIRHKFYSIMRNFASECNRKVSGERDKLDNQKSRLIIELIGRSLSIIELDESTDTSIQNDHILTFLTAFFKGPLDDALDNYYLPRIVELKPSGLHPERILKSLKNSESHAIPTINKVDPASIRNGEVVSDPIIRDCSNAVWFSYTFIKIMHDQIDKLNHADRADYLKILANLLAPAEYILNLNLIQEAFEDPEDQEDVDMDESSSSLDLNQSQKFFLEIRSVITKLIDLINYPSHIENLKPIIFETIGDHQGPVQAAIIRICNLMLAYEHKKIFSCPLLLSLAFNWDFLKRLWKSIISLKNPSLFGESSPIYLQIARGSAPNNRNSLEILLQRLKVFCSLYSYSLPTLDDEEFYTSDRGSMLYDDLSELSSIPKVTHDQLNLDNSNKNVANFFVDKDLVSISAILRDLCVGLIEILCQENRQAYDERSQAQQNQSTIMLSFVITNCFKALVRLVCQIHGRDSRKQFCANEHWICSSAVVPANKAIDFQIVISQQGRLLDQLTRVFCSNNRISSAACEIKTVLILQEIPFVIPFEDRVQILHRLIGREKRLNTSEGYHFGMPESSILAQIRRNYIYEDAFEKLSYDNEPNMKMPLKISLINAAGAHEAGIDGGGLSKEFLSELLKAGFNPMRGFFKTTKDHKLYPNSSAKVLFSNLPEGYEIHYEFLGRMLGKAMFEKVLVELPLATFFLAKLLARKHPSDVDWHNLASLDPVLYKNLVYLKNYNGDVSDLNLDFTITNNELDEHEVVELKPGGSRILVSSENRVEYIHLVADYRLNKQIRPQCAAFKRGLSQLIDLDWLRMFDPRELQILISGAPTLIDMEDWRQNTVYANGYSDESEVIDLFWRVTSQLDEQHKRKLLKFATSCSYPPLLGFKDLYPQFTIAPSEGSRLPTASTCMNLLKLPECTDENTMRSKLLYAINSNSGFELS